MCRSLFSDERWLVLKRDRCPTMRTREGHITRVYEGPHRARGAPSSLLTSSLCPFRLRKWNLLHCDSCPRPRAHAWRRCHLNSSRGVEQSHPAAKATEDNRMLCMLKEKKSAWCEKDKMWRDNENGGHLYNVTMIARRKRKTASWVSRLWVGGMEGAGRVRCWDVRIIINGVVNGANSIHV
jgi:hypothetical protein